MYFTNVFSTKFLSTKNFSINLFNILNYNYSSNLYKLKIDKLYDSIDYGIFHLDESHISNNNSKYPDNALKIYLKKGSYRITYIDGNIDNEIISSSKGNITFNKSNDNINVYFDIKLNKSEYFYIWINSNNSVNLTFQINKLSLSKTNKIEIYDQIFDNNSFPILTFDKNVMYEINLYDISNENLIPPTPKYPKGTYQIVINEVISTNNDKNILLEYQKYDLKKFNVNKLTNKIKDLKNIEIKKDVNPLQFYFMLGEIELIGFFDFNNDKFYIYPNSYLECYMSLLLPNNKFEIIEESSSYLIFKINEFKHISYDYSNINKILLYLNKWTGININDISVENKLYYFGSQNKLSESFISNVILNHINIETYFVYIKLNVSCSIFDNVLNKIENEDTILDYTIDNCYWEVIKDIPNEFNYINWTQPSNWKNTDIENILKSNIIGEGIIKITKQRFKNISNIDINENKTGNLTNEQFKLLNLNDPLISPYNRFQYWISFHV